MESAKASGRDLGISTKDSVVICDFIRGKNLDKAKKILIDAIELKKAVPYKRFNKDLGHKPGIMSGKYPVKSCKEILKLLISAEANAKNKNLDLNSLRVKEIIANKASRPFHYGRFRGRKMRRTHIDITLAEAKK